MPAAKMLVYLLPLLHLGTLSTVAVAATCYAPVDSAKHFQLLAHYSVVNQTACAGFCDQNSECTGYSYQPTPLENKCALLGAVIPSEVCLVPKQIFQQQKGNVKCSVCPLPVNIQTDSCMDSVVGPLSSTGTMCPLKKDGLASYYVIRATLPNGTLITLDNDQVSTLVCSGDQWTYSYNYNNGVFIQPLVTASCVVAGPTKCPCAPLEVYPGTSAAVVNRLNPCDSGKYFKFWYTNMGKEFAIGADQTAETIIKCAAGEWISFHTVSGNSWRVKQGGCM